MGDCIYYIINE